MNVYKNNLADFFPLEFQKFDKCCVDNAADLKQIRQFEVEQKKIAAFNGIVNELDNGQELQKLANETIDTFEIDGETWTFNDYLKCYEVILLFYYNDDIAWLTNKNLHIADFHLTISSANKD